MKTIKDLAVSVKHKLEVTIFFLALTTGFTFGHCDQMNGPLVKDAKKAMDQKNVNIILKWVPANSEAEVKEAFDLVMKVRGLNEDAKLLAEKYLFDVVVRIHRAGEGVAFNGVKPDGTPIDPKVMAADESIAAGNLTPLKGLVKQEDIPQLQQLFNNVMEKKNFDDNNVSAGREYIEAYVQFFKFAEGEHHSQSHHAIED